MGLKCEKDFGRLPKHFAQKGEKNEIKFRSDIEDGDHDRERNFFVLKKTAMPAVLIEHLFFDNYEDARLLMDGLIVDKFAEVQVRTIIRYMK